MAKVLVIGGTGQISAQVTSQVARIGHQVIVLNRGRSRLPVPDGVERVVADRWDSEAFRGAVKAALAGGVDVVIDMICFKPQQAREMIALLRGKVKQYIFCSTVCVYGGHLPTVPASESAPHRPVASYGAEKSECERLILAAFQQGDLPVTIMRPSYTLGPGGLPDSTWGRDPFLADRVRKGKPVLLLDSGNNLWHPGAAADVGSAFALAVGNSKALGQDYNVNGPRIYTHREYFESIGEALGARVELVPVPTHAFLEGLGERASFVKTIFQYHVAFSIEKVRRDLHYEPVVSHEEALRAAVAYLEEHGQLRGSGESDRDDRVIAAVQAGQGDLVRRLTAA